MKWISDRVDGKLSANETPIGHLPRIDDLDVATLSVSKDDLEVILDVDVNCWREYILQIKEFYGKFQDRLPVTLQEILNQLEEKIRPPSLSQT